MKHLNSRNQGKYANDIIIEIGNFLTDSLLSNYKGKFKKYPKSRKRYSQLKIGDIDTPYYRNEIVDFTKKKVSFTVQRIVS